jgi:hypothetical protein
MSKCKTIIFVLLYESIFKKNNIFKKNFYYFENINHKSFNRICILHITFYIWLNKLNYLSKK